MHPAEYGRVITLYRKLLPQHLEHFRLSFGALSSKAAFYRPWKSTTGDAHNGGVTEAFHSKMEPPTMNQPKLKRDPEGTRRRILDAATQQFSTHGLAGARVDAIATAADTNERMLYYYFESKEGLYVAVLEALYVEFANHEVSLDLSGLPPADAIRGLARSIWGYLR